MDADLRLLRYFVAVAEELHFTRAAARLHIAQQPLSAAIRHFETDLGVELFRRTTRHVELTDAGHALLEPARIALRAADDALAAAGRGIAGDLQLGLSSGARYGLEPLFAALAERHPALNLHIRHDSAAPLIDAVRHGRLDLALTFGAQIPDDLEHHRLKDEPVVLAVAGTHALADRHAVALAELRDEMFALDLIWHNTSGPLRPVLAAALTTALNIRDEQHWRQDTQPIGSARGTSHGTRPHAPGVS